MYKSSARRASKHLHDKCVHNVLSRANAPELIERVLARDALEDLRFATSPPRVAALAVALMLLDGDWQRAQHRALTRCVDEETRRPLEHISGIRRIQIERFVDLRSRKHQV